jgi:hypothetical protein
MQRTVLRRGAAVVAAAGVLLAIAGPAAATITGGCTATGNASPGPQPSVDLTTATEWHVLSDSVGGGNGTAPGPMTTAAVSAYALGIGIPIASGNDEDGETTGAVQGVSAQQFALLGKRFVVSGSASGDGGTCSGQITIIIDDVEPYMTALGGGGIAAAVVGLGLVLLTAAGKLGKGVISGIAGALFGLIGGAGLGLALEQFGVVDPTSLVGAAIAVASAVVGLVAGLGPWRGGTVDVPPEPPAPASPPPEAPVPPAAA